MDEIVNGKNLDSILEYCIEIYESDNGYLFSHDLNDKLFPDLTLDEVELLYEYLHDFRPKVLDVIIEGNPCLMKNGLTERFFKSGGFTKKESESNSASDFKKEKELLEFEVLKLQKKISENEITIKYKNDKIRDLTIDNLRLNNWDIRFRWLIAVITFLIGFAVKYFIDN
ncbi:hypothetical protein ACS386_12905 [Flavobacteriaceae bacterium LMO-SS05]